MKSTKLLIGTTVFGLSLLAGCGGTSENTQTRADLHRVMDIASTTMETFKSDKEGDAALADFTGEFEKNLNTMQPAPHPGQLAVNLEKDGSFHGYEDKNNNHVQDSDEGEVFKLEIDTENKRILASDTESVEESSMMGGMGGMMGGMMMGMLMGSLLSRQRSAGVNPASKKAGPTKSAKSTSRSSSSSNKNTQNSARSRSGSGSHASGK